MAITQIHTHRRNRHGSWRDGEGGALDAPRPRMLDRMAAPAQRRQRRAARSNGKVMVKRRERPRAHRKGRPQEQLRVGKVMAKPRTSNGQVMVKRRKRPRAHRKGRSQEQLRVGKVMAKLRTSNGQAMVKRRKRPRAHRKGRSPGQRSNG